MILNIELFRTSHVGDKIKIAPGHVLTVRLSHGINSSKKGCSECAFKIPYKGAEDCCMLHACMALHRPDHQSVIFV